MILPYRFNERTYYFCINLILKTRSFFEQCHWKNWRNQKINLIIKYLSLKSISIIEKKILPRLNATGILNNSNDENRAIIEIDSIFEYDGDNPGKIAICVNVPAHYLVADVASSLNIIPYNYDLFVIVNDDITYNTCTDVFRSLPFLKKLHVHLLGLDEANSLPILCIFRKELLNYDFLAHIQLSVNKYWQIDFDQRDYLLEGLFGSKERVKKIFQLFLNYHDNIGMVFPKPYENLCHWGNTNSDYLFYWKEWFKKFNLSEKFRVTHIFPQGSMFWCKVDAINPLLDSSVSFEHDNDDNSEKNLCNFNCFERIYGIVPIQQGYSILGLEYNYFNDKDNQVSVEAGFIERIVNTSDGWYFSGWAIIPDKHKSAHKILVTNNEGIAILESFVDIERPDIAKKFNNNRYLVSGWEVTIRDFHPSDIVFHAMNDLHEKTYPLYLSESLFHDNILSKPGPSFICPSLTQGFISSDDQGNNWDLFQHLNEITLNKKGQKSIPRKINLIVPFYKNPQLVSSIYYSLLDCIYEITLYDIHIFFYNDSPDDDNLRAELNKYSNKNLKINVVENKENLGFIKTVNQAFSSAIKENRDVILLNSDTYIFRGTIKELIEVAYSDPMIGFVSPRSNNATLCTLPHGMDEFSVDPWTGFMKFIKISKLLPKITYVPTAVGFCLFIKWGILSEFGGFDCIYGKGYNDENDLIMRANRCGYRASLANRAYVWHQGEKSFSCSNQTKNELEHKNAKILNERYPEYLPLVNEYLSSPEYKAEGLICSLYPVYPKEITIGFDFSDFGTYHCGTFEAGKQLLFAAAKCWPKDINLIVFMEYESWIFHSIYKYPQITRESPSNLSRKVSIIIRVGQPYRPKNLKQLVNWAPIIGVFMLDTISTDCGYSRREFDQNIWEWIFKWSDVIFAISQFTADQISRRYTLGNHTSLHAILLSMDIDTYKCQNNFPSLNKPSRGSVLVIGNKFLHKFLEPTVLRLAEELPNIHIFTIGDSNIKRENVTNFLDGQLSDEEIDNIYSIADAVIYPTHYEGFGFPVLHSLARSKPIYIRRLPVFEEILDHIDVATENICWFQTTDELISLLTGGIQKWIGAEARGETKGWERCAREVFDIVMERYKSVNYEIITERIRNFEISRYNE